MLATQKGGTISSSPAATASKLRGWRGLQAPWPVKFALPARWPRAMARRKGLGPRVSMFAHPIIDGAIDTRRLYPDTFPEALCN